MGYRVEAFNGYSLDAGRFLIDQFRIAGVGGKSQVHGPVQEFDLRKRLGSLRLIFYFLQFLVGHRHVYHFLQYQLHGGIGLFQRHAFVQRTAHHQQTRVHGRRDVGADIAEQRLLLDQLLIQPRRFATAQQVAQQVGSLVIGIEATGHMPGFIERVERNGSTAIRSRRFNKAGCGLYGFNGQVPDVLFARRNGTKPPLGQCFDLVCGDVPRHDQHGIVWPVVLEKERFHVIERGVGDVADVFANSGPLVGVCLIGERPQFEPDIAVGLVQVALVKLLDHYFLLHSQHLRIERQTQHPIRFEPEGRLQIGRGQGDVIIGDVGTGEGIVFAPDALQWLVIARNMLRAAEHQVLEQVGKTRPGGVFIARADVVKDIDRSQRRGRIGMDKHAQAIGQGKLLVTDHDKLFGKQAGLSGNVCSTTVAGRAVQENRHLQKYTDTPERPIDASPDQPMFRLLRLSCWLLLLTLPLRAQVLTDASMRQTILTATDNIYGYDFAEANTAIESLRRQYPLHPVGPLLKAISLLWQYMPLEENKTATAQFSQLIEQSIQLSEKMLERNKNDPEGVFFALTAHGYMALRHNNEKEQLKAVGESRRAYGYMKSGFKLMDRNPEFYFTTGLYNYYVERYPLDHPIVKPFMFLFQNGNMALGLQQMDTASKRAIFTRIETSYYLANIYLKHESQPGKAIGYIKFLTDKFPNNPLFQMRYAETLLSMGHYAEARPVIARLRQFPNRMLAVAINTFDGILAERADKSDAAAAERYRAALPLKSYHAYTEEYQSFANAGLARIAARANQREQARAYYKKVLDVTEYTGLQREAKAFLKG